MYILDSVKQFVHQGAKTFQVAAVGKYERSKSIKDLQESLFGSASSRFNDMIMLRHDMLNVSRDIHNSYNNILLSRQ